MNITKGLESFADESIKVGKQEASTSAFNQVYDKYQANQDKAHIRHIMEMDWQNVHGIINQWQLIMIIYTASQKISARVCTD